MREQKDMTIGAAAVTAAPANIAASAIDNSRIRIVWDMVADALGYRVYQSTAQDGVYTQVGEVAEAAFIDTGLTANTTYYYKVAAYDADGSGPLSDPVSAATAAEPDAPKNLTAIAVSPTQIITTWETAAGAEQYNLYRSTTLTGPYELVGMTTAPSHIDVGLIPNTTYYYRVTGVASGVEGGASNIAAATTNADIPVPTNVVAISVSQTQINTMWDAVPNAAAYAVYRGTTPDGTYQYIGTATGPAYSDIGLTPNTTYYYRVAAIVGSVEGSPSAYAAATTFPAVPAPPEPTNVQAQALSCTEILVTWNVSAGAEGYYVYRSESPSGPFQLAGVTSTTNYIDVGRAPSTTYYYFIQAYAGDQFSVQSIPASTVTPPCGAPIPPCPPCCCPCCGCSPCRCPRRRL